MFKLNCIQWYFANLTYSATEISFLWCWQLEMSSALIRNNCPLPSCRLHRITYTLSSIFLKLLRLKCYSKNSFVKI